MYGTVTLNVPSPALVQRVSKFFTLDFMPFEGDRCPLWVATRTHTVLVWRYSVLSTVVNTKVFQPIYFCGTNHDVKIFMLNFPIAYFPPLTKLSTIFRSNDTTAFAKIWLVKRDSRMNFSSEMYCKYSIIKNCHP